VQNLEQPQEVGFTYVSSPIGGRLYSTWKDGETHLGQFSKFVKWSPEIRLGFLISPIFVALLEIAAPGQITFITPMFLLMAVAAYPERLHSILKGIAVLWVVFVTAGLFSDYSIMDATVTAVIAASFIIGLCTYVSLTVIEFQRARMRKNMPPRDEPSSVPSLPCAIRLHSNGVFLGADIGWVAFVDDFLHFQGRTLEFSLLGSNVKVRKNRRSPEPADDFGIQLQWQDRRRNLVAHLEPLERSPAKNRKLLAQMRSQVLAWSDRAKPEDQIGTFPPNYASDETIHAKQASLDRAVIGLWVTLGVVLLFVPAGALFITGREVLWILPFSAGLFFFFLFACRRTAVELDSLPRDVLHGRG
jgi:hypothetical protein